MASNSTLERSKEIEYRQTICRNEQDTVKANVQVEVNEAKKEEGAAIDCRYLVEGKELNPTLKKYPKSEKDKNSVSPLSVS